MHHFKCHAKGNLSQRISRTQGMLQKPNLHGLDILTSNCNSSRPIALKIMDGKTKVCFYTHHIVRTPKNYFTEIKFCCKVFYA